MDNRKQEALDAILTAKKYRDICPDTVRRAFDEQSARHKNIKDADKAARAHLHAITGAFISRDEISKAEKLIEKWLSGDESALKAALSMHASTRERAEIADELFRRVFSLTGKVDSIIDLACGLNPVYLGHIGLTNVYGTDIHTGCVRLINECAKAKGWQTHADTHDLIASVPEGRYDLALLMKLLPVMETQKTGAAKKLLMGINARFVMASFPTRTLGGRGVGMEKHYTEWFESLLDESVRVLDRFVIGNELVYVLEKG